MTKHSFLLLLLGISFTLSAQSTWQQTSGPEGCSLFDIERNSTTVFAATTNGLWQSTDEGATWSLNNAQMFDQSVDALYVSNNELLVLSVEFKPNYEVAHHFYRSTDGGGTWAYHELAGDIGGLSEDEIEMWRDGAIIWITDRYDNCFKSLDNGVTWIEVVFPQGFYSNFIAAHGDKILVFGYFSTLRSEDGGITWIETADTTSLNDVYFEGDLIMYTDGDSVSVSQDFGITWQTAPFDSYAFGGVKRGDDGFLYRFYNNIFRSFDGLTWTPVTQLTPFNYFSTGVQSGAAFIVGGNGMYKTANNNTQILPSQSGLLNAGCKSVASMASGRLIVSTQSNGGTWSTYNKGLNWSKLDNPGAHPYNQVSFNTMTAQGDTVWGVGSNDTLYRIIGNATTWEKTIDCNSWYTGETFVRIIDSVVYLVESEQIRRSFDRGATWEVLLTVTNNNDFRGIAKVGNYLFYSTNDGIVFRSADNGLTWENNYEIWSPGAHRLNALTTQNDVLFLWNDDEAFYTMDYGASWIQMGFNGLPVNSWWNEPYFEAVDIKHFGNAILVTIPYNGVWITFDFGNNWVPLNDGLTNKRGRYLAISGNDIFLATSTSSVWRLGANFEVFTGNIYNDLNNNGQKDAGEGPLANRIVGAEPLGSYTTSNNGGLYSLVAAAQLDTIRMQPPNNYCTVSPPFHAVTQPNGNYDFGVHFTEGIVDLSIDMVNWEPFRPGFDNKITLTVQNIGNETVQNAQVIAVLPSTLSIDFITPLGLATVSNDTLFWSIATIAPFASMSIQIEVTLSVNAPIGSTLSLYGHVDATNDVDATNNEIWLSEIVVGSYDPNDKYAVSGIAPQAVLDGEPINYIVRFENTGTFYAEKVVITDVLDKNLNPATFQFLSASHPCQWRITAEGKVEFTFNDIFLEVNETGFVKFSVEADRSLQLNDIVSNTANIYFDFNAPIITNTVETTVTTSVTTHTPYLSNINIELSPNPAKNMLYATVGSDMVKNGQAWEIVDAAGTVLLREKQRSETTSFAIVSLPNGIYEVVLRNRNATVIGSKTVVVAH